MEEPSRVPGPRCRGRRLRPRPRLLLPRESVVEEVAHLPCDAWSVLWRWRSGKCASRQGLAARLMGLLAGAPTCGKRGGKAQGSRARRTKAAVPSPRLRRPHASWATLESRRSRQRGLRRGGGFVLVRLVRRQPGAGLHGHRARASLWCCVRSSWLKRRGCDARDANQAAQVSRGARVRGGVRGASSGARSGLRGAERSAAGKNALRRC